MSCDKVPQVKKNQLVADLGRVWQGRATSGLFTAGVRV